MQATTKRWLKRAVIGGALALVLGAGLTVYLLQRPPAVWVAAQQVLSETTAEQRADLAEGVVRKLSSANHRLDADDDAVFGDHPAALDPARLAQALADQPVDETFEIELSNQELLSVASDWAEKWVAQRGFEMPEQMDQPIVMIQNGELVVAFRVAVGSWNQIFAGKVKMRFDPDGMAHGSVSELTAGSLPMPTASAGEWIAKQVPSSKAGKADQIGEWIAELEDFEFRPVLELEHRRRARVLAMQLKQQSMVMTMRLQDHKTYKQHNTLMKVGSVAVSDVLHPAMLDGSAIADVPTTTE